MNDLSEFQQRACAAGLQKMFSGKHFNICDLDALAKTMGRENAMAGRDYSALRAIHCMDWAEMGPDLAEQVRQKCCELLGLPSNVIDAVAREVKEPTPSGKQKRAGLLSLIFRGQE